MPEPPKGIEVTARDLASPGDSQTQVIDDDYCLVTAGDCYVAGTQVHPVTGTHVITVKNVRRKP
jgi:hypothetical protein